MLMKPRCWHGGRWEGGLICPRQRFSPKSDQTILFHTQPNLSIPNHTSHTIPNQNQLRPCWTIPLDVFVIQKLCSSSFGTSQSCRIDFLRSRIVEVPYIFRNNFKKVFYLNNSFFHRHLLHLLIPFEVKIPPLNALNTKVKCTVQRHWIVDLTKIWIFEFNLTSQASNYLYQWQKRRKEGINQGGWKK